MHDTTVVTVKFEDGSEASWVFDAETYEQDVLEPTRFWDKQRDVTVGAPYRWIEVVNETAEEA